MDLRKRTIKMYPEAVKPEAVYFAIKEGRQMMGALVNIPGEDMMAAMTEPLWYH
jgi:hypothetical protein